MIKGSHLSEEHKKKISEAKKGDKNPNWNKHPSMESCRRMSESHKGKKNTNYGKTGKNHPKWKGGDVEMVCKLCYKKRYVASSSIKRGRGICCSRRCATIYRLIHQKNHNTDIERLVENELIRRNIPYTKQVALLGITLVDFLLPNDTVIYCDGSYWHSFDKAKIKDMNQDFMLKFYGYKVFRFTEKEIKKSPKKCIANVIKEDKK